MVIISHDRQHYPVIIFTYQLFYSDYMTNYSILDIIIDIVSWSCFIILHIMFASCSCTYMHPT